MYSQNNEDLAVSNYFGDYAGTVLDIGANDGITFSNSCYLIQKGWKGVLIEPSPTAFDLLEKRYKGNKDVDIFNIAIGDFTGYSDFYDSGAHVPNGTDIALVSSIKLEETRRWHGVHFEKMQVMVFKIEDSPIKGTFDFISIDCEGADFSILQQLDLNKLNCSCLCIEYNQNALLLSAIIDYCKPFGLTKVLLQNAENIILAK